MQRKIAILVLMCLFVLVACASSVPLKAEKKASIQSISINHQVQMPDVMFYREPKYASYAFGVIGNIADNLSQMKNQEIIRYLMNTHDIDVARIVRERFRHEMERNRVFNSVVAEGGDAEIALTIRIYGFGHDFSGKLKPMLGVTGSLAQGDSVVWKKYAYVTNLNKQTPPNAVEQLVNNPERIREAFDSAAQIVVQDLCGHMQGN